MRNAFAVLFAAAGVLVLPSAASAQSPSTTRIETRPFYGATVTLEEGVRVFRPLPPHERIIINPQGATPLNLSYEQSHSVSHNYHYDGDGRDAVPVYGGAGIAGDWSARPRRVHKPHHGFRGHGGGVHQGGINGRGGRH